MTKEIDIRKEHFVLHNSGAMYWKEKNTLIISDVHLGKISHFRKFGSAVPQNAVEANFRKMDEVLLLFDPQKLVFLGDLFHSAINKEWALFEKWMVAAARETILVEGNHDIISPLRYEALGIKMFPALEMGSFLFTHDPVEREGFYNFSGHLHPGVRITGLGRQELKLSCFYRSRNQMILPAFGEFTGKFFVNPEKGEKAYVLTKEEVIQLSY